MYLLFWFGLLVSLLCSVPRSLHFILYTYVLGRTYVNYPHASVSIFHALYASSHLVPLFCSASHAYFLLCLVLHESIA